MQRAKQSSGPVSMTELMEEEEEAIKQEAEKKRLEELARKQKLIATAKYSLSSINPFDVWQIVPSRDRGWDSGRSLSEKQLKVLKDVGIDPSNMEYRKAKQLLTEVFERRKKNLCTFKQQRLLLKYGVTDQNLTFTQARRAIDSIAAAGWQAPLNLHETIYGEPMA